jgi:hypothetical protein
MAFHPFAVLRIYKSKNMQTQYSEVLKYQLFKILLFHCFAYTSFHMFEFLRTQNAKNVFFSCRAINCEKHWSGDCL